MVRLDNFGRQNSESKKKPAPKDASPKLSVGWLFKPEEDPGAFQIQKEILKNLILKVFGSQTVFKRL